MCVRTSIFLLFCSQAVCSGDAVDRQLAAIQQQRQAIETQRKAVVRQNPEFFAGPAVAVAAQPPACEPLSPVRAGALIDRESRRTGVSSNLIHAVIQQESAFRPCAVSEKGALGLMQLMPDTAAELGVADPFDPDQNVSGGATLLKQLTERYAGDLNRVLGAYNAGPARVDAADGVPPIAETIQYVRSVMNHLPP